MNVWLDTETKALLQHVPPEKNAPPYTGKFSLVLLKKGKDVTRLEQALARIHGISSPKAAILVTQHCPLPISMGLSSADALLGQFELICCDSVSIFVKTEVISSATGSYLSRLYSQIQSSTEFEEVIIDVHSIPNNEQGKRLLHQFFGDHEEISCDANKGYSLKKIIMRKKARILEHWARKIGAEALIEDYTS
jgi:hypothetical protein